VLKYSVKDDDTILIRIMEDTMLAKKLNEFPIDRVITDPVGQNWGIVQMNQSYSKYPEIVEVGGIKFYRMSFNSDKNEVYYKEARGLQYQERYSQN
jgi:hypothetical protein